MFIPPPVHQHGALNGKLLSQIAIGITQLYVRQCLLSLMCHSLHLDADSLSAAIVFWHLPLKLISETDKSGVDIIN